MIRSLIIGGRPCIDMHMLQLRTSHQRLANENMVQFLGIIIVEIRVSLCFSYSRGRIEILKARNGDKCCQGFNKGVFVEVAGGDDLGVGILSEDGGGEVLEINGLVYEVYS